MEEAVGHVEGGAAPHLQGEAVVQDLCRALGALEHIAGAHPGGQKGLVGVRMVVSVMSSFFCPSTQSRTASGPFSSKSCLRPVHLGGVCS